MSLATLIAAHGYWILALGCLLEGETVLVLAALAALVAWCLLRRQSPKT